ncbi:photosystem I reaction center subunit XII [Synechococcus sp. Ace-Pa]|nr:photosystem I reaction center subunit XII [Synechococcus sp. Ace-Pa]
MTTHCQDVAGGGIELNNGGDICYRSPAMVTTLSQAEVLIALVVAAHAGVLAIRLCVSLYNA